MCSSINTYQPALKGSDVLKHLNLNTLGFTYDAYGWKDEDHIWVHMVDQPEDVTDAVRALQPDMPEKYNNLLVRTGSCSFFTIPFVPKY